MAQGVGIALVVFSSVVMAGRYGGSNVRPGSRAARIDASLNKVPLAVFFAAIVIGVVLLIAEAF